MLFVVCGKDKLQQAQETYHLGVGLHDQQLEQVRLFLAVPQSLGSSRTAVKSLPDGSASKFWNTQFVASRPVCTIRNLRDWPAARFCLADMQAIGKVSSSLRAHLLGISTNGPEKADPKAFVLSKRLKSPCRSGLMF